MPSLVPPSAPTPPARRRRGWVPALIVVGVLLAGGAITATVYPQAAAVSADDAATVTPRAVDPSPVASPTASPSASATVTPTATPAATPTAEPSRAPAETSALAVLGTLDVKGRAPKTGYARDQFGDGWRDPDHNGCDTRNDILARDLADTTTDGPCTVLTGVLADPYTATLIDFVRGRDTSSRVQIDHVVALSDAWQKGAQKLSPGRREALANDPLNLLAVDGPANGQKSDGDAATWLPANKTFRCAYVARQVSVKAAYDLWVTPAERDAIAGVLARCPDEPATTSAAARAAGEVDSATPAPTEKATAPETKTTKKKAPKEPASADVSYRNCAAVRAAGADPIRRGESGYASHLDRDGDGIGCE